VLRHATCATVVELRRIAARPGIPSSDVLWCCKCMREVSTDELDPPGPVCYVED
jgi:hypothetical protein